MKKAVILLSLLALLLVISAPLPAGHILEIEIAHWCGSTNPKMESQVITSYQLTPIFQGSIEVKPEADLVAQLKKSFNLPNVFLVMNDKLIWDSTKAKEIEKNVLIGGAEYTTILTPVSLNGSYKFRIRIAIGGSGDRLKHLVDSEIVLTAKQPVVIGFRGDPRDDMRHFLSLRILKASETPESATAAQRVSGTLRPKLIKRVAPVYPDEALKKKLQGVILVDATIDIYGNVKTVKVESDTDPVLNTAACDAVKQWVFEPYIDNGKPKEVSFSVTVTFKLAG